MKKWLYSPPQKESVALIASTLNLPLFLSQVLVNRGLNDPGEAAKFLSPKLNHLRDPFEIPNITKAAERLLLAKERGEKVLIYGDYDVDGVTGTVILVETCRLLGITVSYYIPHRYGEGYGLSLESVRKIAAEGVQLIVTVDCGIASFIEIEEANALGLEVIVTDHHNLPRKLPNAVAIVNPKQLPGEHPTKYLSGAGVAFKFAWALLRTAGIKDSVFLTSLLDLASLGTLSDVVPLTGENRIIAVGGLNLVNERKRLGLKHLAEAASLRGRIQANQVYFGLAPRLNAAGRLEHAAKAVELLLAADPLSAQQIAKELMQINSRRQDLGAAIKDEAFAQVKEVFSENSKLLILIGEKWHPGVIGIVASQLVDTYYRPTVLIGINEGVGRGSARSIEGINIYQLLDSCHDLFLDFGGHEGAAGFEILPENIPELRRRLVEVVEAVISPDKLIPTLNIDAKLEATEINLSLAREIEKLAPHGEGNPRPVFMLINMELTNLKKVGVKGRHLKAWFSQGGVNLETIGFGLGEKGTQLNIGQSYDIAFNLESNEFNGFETAQLSLIDIRESN